METIIRNKKKRPVLKDQILREFSFIHVFST